MLFFVAVEKELTIVNVRCRKLAHTASMGDMLQTEKNQEILIRRYVSVCNEAISVNRQRFPFKQIFEAAKQAEEGHKIEVSVSGSSESYVFQIKGDAIVYERHSACDDCQCVRKWVAPESYLMAVISEPDTYIKNPAHLDWGWLYD